MACLFPQSQHQQHQADVLLPLPSQSNGEEKVPHHPRLPAIAWRMLFASKEMLQLFSTAPNQGSEGPSSHIAGNTSSESCSVCFLVKVSASLYGARFGQMRADWKIKKVPLKRYPLWLVLGLSFLWCIAVSLCNAQCSPISMAT